MPRTFTAREIIDKKIDIAKFAMSVLPRDVIKRRIEEMADSVAPRLRKKKVTFVTLGYGALYFSAKFTAQKCFDAISSQPLFIRARGYNGTTPVQLRHDAESIADLPTQYSDTEIFVLLDEVRHSGQSMFKMKRYFKERFTTSEVLSVCLVDRPDCIQQNQQFNEPLSVTGFCVSHPDGKHLSRRTLIGAQGWLVGFGMDILNHYRGLKGVWWTTVEPDPGGNQQLDCFIRPRDDEGPIIQVPLHDQLANSAMLPLRIWWK